ncbi:response regulator transcription factor [Chryseobacterium sp. GP-SGM7]|uniref:response regulator transcription factor n=1 Tax=Chryseobacterium sp. GP-SGM7 TaxID=3411323 RepID=UPI003B949D89
MKDPEKNIAFQSQLEEKLLNQKFKDLSESKNTLLQKCQQLAKDFVDLKNGIAILSDLRYNKSYIYKGKLAEKINVFQNKDQDEIESIWEEELFSKLNSYDVLQKHVFELQFFQFIKTIPADQQKDYYVLSRLRIEGKDDQALIHKMFYFKNEGDENVQLALCLYYFDFMNVSFLHGIIVNTADGSIIQQTDESNSNMLTAREKEILLLIQKGKISKEIADKLYISINTVNRHRQNILEKLRVVNTTEACSLAIKMRWI